MKKIVFELDAFNDFAEWVNLDRDVDTKIVRMLHDMQAHPFQGIGSPEPLYHELQGYWSRRIDDEHRLVYKVAQNDIVIVSCRYYRDTVPKL